MLTNIPGKGIGMAAKKIGEAVAKPSKGGPKMDFLKKKLTPMKKNQMSPKKLETTMPLKKLPTSMPMKKTDDPKVKQKAKPYEPGSLNRGYTKYA